MSRETPSGVKVLSFFLSTEEMGEQTAWETMGEIVGETRPAGEDLSGNIGLVMLPRLQSRKRPL